MHSPNWWTSEDEARKAHASREELIAQVRLHQAVLDRAQDWQSQRRSMLELHAVLAAQADAGLRVERWQFDGHSLVLQAWLPAAVTLASMAARSSVSSPRVKSWMVSPLASARTLAAPGFTTRA